jgi:hypothetical protein
MQTHERQPELPFFSPVMDEIKEGIQEEETPARTISLLMPSKQAKLCLIACIRQCSCLVEVIQLY